MSAWNDLPWTPRGRKVKVALEWFAVWLVIFAAANFGITHWQ